MEDDELPAELRMDEYDDEDENDISAAAMNAYGEEDEEDELEVIGKLFSFCLKL